MTEKRLKLPKSTFEALQDLADRRGDTVEQTLRHCINTEIYMSEQLAKGNTILCKEPLGKAWRIVFTYSQ
jgi:hypothetical protein